MNHFALFRTHIAEELFCGIKDPISDEDFFQRLYSMDQEDYGAFIALDILYSLPAREEDEKISELLNL